MPTNLPRLLILSCLAALCGPSLSFADEPKSNRATSEQIAFFEAKIRPLLIAHCGECHGEEEPEGELTLTTTAGLLAGRPGGQVIVAGAPTASSLIQAVRYTGRLKMPPESKLDEQLIVQLTKWVKSGAATPLGTPGARPAADFQITPEDRTFWSHLPISDPPAPQLADDHWSLNHIDRFVLRKLREHGLEPSPRAAKLQLVRRATFDLLGLPPTGEQIESFLADNRPDAWERLVDRLLASPEYGERWGRRWLDVARYADTNGGGFDYVYPTAYQYRDYVVRAHNADKPFDQFLIEQLAGDLLPFDGDEDAYVEARRATGFLTLAPKGLGQQDKTLMVMDVVDDQLDVIGRSLLGVTISCARCHDHKFDPISTADYYALGGILHSTRSVQDTDKNPSYWPEVALESPPATARRKALAKQLADAKSRLGEYSAAAQREIVAGERPKLERYLLKAAASIDDGPGRRPVGHWDFNEVNAATAASNAGPALTLSNFDAPDKPTPRSLTGRFGNALEFASPGSVVQAEGPLAAIDFGTTDDFTISFWMRTDKGYAPQTADTLVSANYGSAMWFIALRPGGYNGIYLRHYNGKTSVDIKPQQSRQALLTDGGWHNIVFTNRRANEGSVYIDGELVGAAPIKAVSRLADFSKSTKFSIGSSHNQFRGAIDDVVIWRQALEPRDVKVRFAVAQAIDFDARRSRELLDFAASDLALAIVGDFAVSHVKATSLDWGEVSSADGAFVARTGIDGRGVTGRPATAADRQLVEKQVVKQEDEKRSKTADGPPLIPALVDGFVSQLRRIDPSSPLLPLAAFVHSPAAARGAKFGELSNDAKLKGHPARQLLADFAADPPSTLSNAVTRFVAAANAKVDDKETALSQSLSSATGPLRAKNCEPHFTAAARERIAAARARVAELTERQPPPPISTMVAADGPAPHNLAIHVAGNPKNLAAVVERRFPAIFSTDQPEIAAGSSGRLEMGRWIANERNPRTARVAVNRVWQGHFGQALVRTSDDFGRQGERPSHPELLDWLSSELTRNGWSMKWLHRTILRSATYQQSSVYVESAAAKDGGNRLLWRMNRRRLEAEALRDALLAVSAELDLQMYGTFQNWKPKIFSVDDANRPTATYESVRRSIYLPIVRDAVYEVFQLFDFSDPNSVYASRVETTVASQALFLMNSSFVDERATRFADLCLQQPASERLEFVYRRALGRPPTADEMARGEAFLVRIAGAAPPDSQPSHYALKALAKVVFSLNEFIYVD